MDELLVFGKASKVTVKGNKFNKMQLETTDRSAYK